MGELLYLCEMVEDITLVILIAATITYVMGRMVKSGIQSNTDRYNSGER